MGVKVGRGLGLGLLAFIKRSSARDGATSNLFNNAKISLHYLAWANLYRYEKQGIIGIVGTRMKACQQQQDCEDLPVGLRGALFWKECSHPSNQL